MSNMSNKNISNMTDSTHSSDSPYLSLIVIRVSDIDLASRFYASLGLSFQSEKHGTGPKHYSTEIGKTVLELYPATEKFPVSSVRLGFNVASIQEVLAKIAEFEHQIISEPKDSPWGYRCVIVDPDGHRIELSQAKS